MTRQTNLSDQHLSSVDDRRVHMQHARHTQHFQQQGFSLIEVMVSALVLSVSLLGILGLQLVGMKGTQQSYMKQQAMGVIQNTMERMSANHAGVINGDYNNVDSTSFDCTQAMPSCNTSNCNSTQVALVDKLNLICGYKTGTGSRTGGVKFVSAGDNLNFSNGKLKINCRPTTDCSLGDVHVRVDWTERALGDEPPQPDFLELNLRITAP